MFLSTVASQYLVGSRSPSGHSIKSVSSPRFAAPLIGAVRTRTRAKRERSLSFVPSRQVIVRQACLGRLSANCLVLRRACSAQTIGHFSHFDRRHDRCHVFEPQSTDAGAQRGVGAVTRIDQHGTARHARRIGLADLLQRDLRFSLERDRIGNTCFLATGRVFCPFLRQIKPVGDRQAGMMIRRSTTSLPPDNWLACQAARNTDGAPRPTWSRTSEKTYRR